METKLPEESGDFARKTFSKTLERIVSLLVKPFTQHLKLKKRRNTLSISETRRKTLK